MNIDEMKKSNVQVIINIIFVMFFIMLLPIFINFIFIPSNIHQLLPDVKGCGIAIDENQSEQWFEQGSVLIGKVIVPTNRTGYYHDLVCSNGTVILRWSK
jgi:hypothetical protein